MPIYEYKCGYCRYKWQDLIRTKKEEPEACPECGSKDIRKVPSVSTPMVR